MLRRLAHSQDNHTILDLLGDESNLADQFPAEDFVNGYKGHKRAGRRPQVDESPSRASVSRLMSDSISSADTRGNPESPTI